MLTVLRGLACDYLTVEVGGPCVSVLRPRKVEPADNEDFVDLAGICGELHLVRPEVAYAYHHLRDVRHDIANVLKRRAVASNAAIPWAREYMPLVMQAVEYFWPAIQSLAAAAPDSGKMLGDQVTEIVSLNKPNTATPEALVGRFKPGFVVTPSGHAGPYWYRRPHQRRSTTTRITAPSAWPRRSSARRPRTPPGRLSGTPCAHQVPR